VDAALLAPLENEDIDSDAAARVSTCVAWRLDHVSWRFSVKLGLRLNSPCSIDGGLFEGEPKIELNAASASSTWDLSGLPFFETLMSEDGWGVSWDRARFGEVMEDCQVLEIMVW